MKKHVFVFSGCGELLIGYHLLMVFNEEILGEGVKIMKMHWHETLVGVVENNAFHVFSIETTSEI